MGRITPAHLLALGLCQSLVASAAYNPVREYSGQSFFSGWDYYGNYDNLTLGAVNYLTQSDPAAASLAYVNSAGNAIIKVDNTSTVVWDNKRNSIRVTTKDSYPVGSLFIMDALHLPYGCSVWPSFWTKGDSSAVWPAGGEIDIVEYVNQMGNNQVALHTNPGCAQAASPGQSGKTLQGDCSQDAGCSVAETKPNSFGGAFAQAGGGVFAAQFDVSGIFIWFWSRADIPANIKSATSTSSIDTSSWGQPTGAYPSSGCDITKYFAPQQLVLDITLCGTWADAPNVYNSTCPTTPTGICYNDNVMGTGANYANAYFEISYIRTYSTLAANTSSSSPSGSPTPSGAHGSSSSPASGGSPGPSASPSSALGAASYSVSLALAAALSLSALVLGAAGF